VQRQTQIELYAVLAPNRHGAESRGRRRDVIEMGVRWAGVLALALALALALVAAVALLQAARSAETAVAAAAVPLQARTPLCEAAEFECAVRGADGGAGTSGTLVRVLPCAMLGSAWGPAVSGGRACAAPVGGSRTILVTQTGLENLDQVAALADRWAAPMSVGKRNRGTSRARVNSSGAC
jgi:hypothetical protein